MRLLVATGLYPPDIGGPATHTVFLEKHQETLGLELVVVPFGSVRRYPPLIRHLIYFFRLVSLGRTCEMIYALDTVSVGVPVMLASIITRKPFILRVPGDYAWEQGQQRYGVTETLDAFRTHTAHPIRVRVMSSLQSLVAKRAKHIIVPSEYMKRVVAGWGIREAKITRIYSVLDPISHEMISSRPTNVFRVITAARLVPWKGIDALIESVVRLKNEGVPIELYVCGDGTSRRDLERKTASLGADAYVHFEGALTRSVLAQQICVSHVFVLNTSYEGLSHQLIEVMHLGVPIITTPAGGNSELITDGYNGHLVTYNDIDAISDALNRVYREPAQAQILAEHAQDSLARFNEEQIVSELSVFFKTICNL